MQAVKQLRVEQENDQGLEMKGLKDKTKGVKEMQIPAMQVLL